MYVIAHEFYEKTPNYKIILKLGFKYYSRAVFQGYVHPFGASSYITNMYLIGDTKLWWHTRAMDDDSVGRPKIEM